MTKRQAVFACITALVVLLLGAAFFFRGTPEASYEPLEAVSVVVCADPHYLSPDLTDNGPYFQTLIENGDGKAMTYCEEITEDFLQAVIRQQPDALILAGDLTFNGEKQSHEVFAQKLSIIEAAGIPVLVLPGNHDIENPMAASFQGDGYTPVESISGEQFAEIYRNFGFGEAVSRDSGSLSYRFPLTKGLSVLMVDTNTPEAPGTVTDSTLRWVETQLKEAARHGTRILAVSHQNLLRHNSLFYDGFVMGNSSRLLVLYEKYGVICNLSGHMHIQHITHSKNGFEEIATASLMVSPHLYGILTIEETSADYRTNSAGSGEYSSISQAFLWDTAYRQAAAVLGEGTDTHRMSRFFADINTAYISGRMDTVSWDEELFDLWKKQNTFLTVYLQSIRNDGLQNHTAAFHFAPQPDEERG